MATMFALALGLAIAASGIAIGWVVRGMADGVKCHRIKVGKGWGWVIAWEGAVQ